MTSCDGCFSNTLTVYLFQNDEDLCSYKLGKKCKDMAWKEICTKRNVAEAINNNKIRRNVLCVIMKFLMCFENTPLAIAIKPRCTTR